MNLPNGTTIYEPLSWEKSVGYRIFLEYCRASVHEGGRSVTFRQCARKPTRAWVSPEGVTYRLCGTHARGLQ